MRYIGQTTVTLKKRLMNHRAKSKKANHPVACWIRKHESMGNTVLITKLCDGVWNKTEQEILATCKDIKAKLLNCTDGGEGTLGCSWKLSEKTKSNMSRGHIGLKLSKEHKKAISRGNKGKKRSNIVKIGMSERMKKVGQPVGGLQKGDNHTKEACRKISVALKGKEKSLSHRNKLKEAALRRWSKVRGEI